MFYDFPIKYHEPVFRPPSEGRSLLIQQTIGCSNNKCTYCNMYRSKTYKERNSVEVIEDIKKAAAYYRRFEMRPSKVFLCDGDALGAPTEDLYRSLLAIREEFGDIRVGVYATAQNMLDKTAEELRYLKEAGLGIAYLGMESGCDKVLHMTVKGNSAQDMIDGSRRVMDAGMKLSIIAMLGLGGKKHTETHVRETARVLSEISPDYLSFLTTMAIEGTPYYRMVQRGLEMLTTKEILGEMHDILSGVQTSREILLRINHVSNMYPIGGSLPQDQATIIQQVKQWFDEAPEGTYPPKPSHM
ncbi:radical SAM domain protein [Bacteriovorax sp. BAL6_X]|uniref:radical SAM protein n=1 Tax=Bacteriovorax sp. BAL6_X TaxID=1201290 RepID=UPI00038687B5|nr:radical SAM protein [Bacteriovorax sp. BAL6_X]EPZ52138.1 radical SAM domain protein [Bacteriovorax sp. BAL6_X]